MWLSETPGQDSMQRNDPLGQIKKKSLLCTGRSPDCRSNWPGGWGEQGEKGTKGTCHWPPNITLWRCSTEELKVTNTNSQQARGVVCSHLTALWAGCFRTAWTQGIPLPLPVLPPFSLFLPCHSSDEEQELGRENKPPQTTQTNVRILMGRKKKVSLFNLLLKQGVKLYIYNITPTPIVCQGTS